MNFIEKPKIENYKGHKILFVTKRLAQIMLRKSCADNWMFMYLPIKDNHYISFNSKENVKCVLVCPETNHNLIVCINQVALKG